MRLLTAKDFLLDALPVKRDKIILARIFRCRFLIIAKQADRAFALWPRDQRRGVRFDNDRVSVRTVPRPMNLV